MTDREKELEQRLAKSQRMFIRSWRNEIQSTAMMMLAQNELLLEKYGVDIEKEEPELYESLKSKADGSWLQEGVE